MNKIGYKTKVALAGIFGLAIIVVILELTNTTHFFHKTAVVTPTTGSSFTKGIKSNDKTANRAPSSSSPSTSQSRQSSSTKYPTGVDANTQLLAPSGTFANVYSAHITEQMGSTCNTTPGATCQIFFTSGSTTKSLPEKTADSGGAVYWAWRPNDSNVGLTEGTWHITAKATLGTQVKTTDNGSLELTITK
jgi:hypothetical protein